MYGIVFVFAASCTTTPDKAAPGTEEQLQAYEVLHRRLRALTEQDNTYAGLLSSQVATTELDERSGRIIQAEMALQHTIDSLDRVSLNNPDSTQKANLAHITSYFKALLQSRRLLSDMRMALSAESDDSTTAQQMLAQLQNDLRERDERIAALEKANAATPVTRESMEQLRQRNKMLQQSLQAMETKYFTVGRNYLVLKKEHERTVNELTALRKGGQQ